MGSHKRTMQERRQNYEATIAISRQRLALGTQGHKEAQMVRAHDADPEKAFAAWLERTERQMTSAAVREKDLRPKIISMLRDFGPVASLEHLRSVLRCDDAALRLAVEALLAAGQVTRAGGARKGDGLTLVAPPPPTTAQARLPLQPTPAPDAALLALSDALRRRDAEIAEVRAELARQLRVAADQRAEIDRLTSLLDQQTRPGGIQ